MVIDLYTHYNHVFSLNIHRDLIHHRTQQQNGAERCPAEFRKTLIEIVYVGDVMRG